MTKQVSATFIKNLQANLAFWSSELGDANGRLIKDFDLEKDNLLLAVHYGLLFDESRSQTASLLLSLFPSIEKRHETTRWATYYQKSLDCTSQVINSTVMWQLTNRVGQIQRLEGKQDDAIRTHLELFAQLQKTQEETDPILVVRVLFNLCEDYRLANEFKQARYYAYQAVEELETLHFSKEGAILKASTLNSLGLVLIAIQEYSDASSVLREAISIWERVGEQGTVDHGRTIHSLADALKLDGQIKDATYYLQQAIDIFDQNQSYGEMVRTQNSLGTLYQQIGQFEKAKEIFDPCLSALKNHSIDASIQGMLFHNVGNNYLFLEQFDHAELYFVKAARHWEQLDQQMNLGNSIGGLGEAYEGQGLLNLAIINYEKAIYELDKFLDNELAQNWRREFSSSLNRLLK